MPIGTKAGAFGLKPLTGMGMGTGGGGGWGGLLLGEPFSGERLEGTGLEVFLPGEPLWCIPVVSKSTQHSVRTMHDSDETNNTV